MSVSSLSHRLRLRRLCQPRQSLFIAAGELRLDRLVVAGADGRSALDLQMFWEMSVASLKMKDETVDSCTSCSACKYREIRTNVDRSNGNFTVHC